MRNKNTDGRMGMDDKVGLILEGGAMRSVFSAGVLDFFLEKDVKIPNILAVSAGAYAGMNYVSGQKGRILSSIIEPLLEYKYMGLGTFLKKGTFFDLDYLFYEVPKTKAPFDFKAFKEFKGRFLTSTVNCKTGENIYHENFESEEAFFEICKAANSLPLIAKITEIDGEPMLDGGMADAIPIEKALSEGFKKCIIVLTRDSSYRKTEGRTAYIKAIRMIYKKYPKFLELIEGRAQRYNEALDKIAQLEDEGKAFVLRPTKLTLRNNESDVDSLKAYYLHGYESAKERYEELVSFLTQ